MLPLIELVSWVPVPLATVQLIIVKSFAFWKLYCAPWLIIVKLFNTTLGLEVLDEPDMKYLFCASITTFPLPVMFTSAVITKPP